ncbi:MAG: LCP family protein [Actinobacteria bacterium]|nr:LCP family protein [Actinomycetota bacterium]
MDEHETPRADDAGEHGDAADEPVVSYDGRPPAVPAGLLSSVVTGAGQWYAGRRRRALWFFLPTGIVLAAGAVFAVAQGRTELLVKSVQVPWLWALFAVNLALLAFRAVSTTDAWMLGRRSLQRRWIAPAGLAAALAITAVPHVLVASYTIDQIDFLQTVFDPPSTTATTDPDVYAGPILTTTTTPPPQATTTTTTEPRPIGVPEFTLPEATLPAEEFLPLDGLAEGRYLSILLAGGDAGPGRGGLRTDTMIVATLDLELDRAYLFGISRELVHIPLPSAWDGAFEELEDRLWEIEYQDWFADQDASCKKNGQWKKNPPESCPEEIVQPERCECFPDRLNAIYTYTRNWSATWPDSPAPGMEALRQAMQTMLAIPIDYYVLVDMAGFVSLVDALGGVDLWVYEPVHQGFSPAVEGGPIVRVDVDPGYHHLDGNQALAYVRSRDNVGDTGRIRRQRCLIRSVAAAADPLTLLWNFSSIVGAIKDNTTTNIPLEFLPELVRAAAELQLDDIATVSLTGSYYYDEEDWRGIPTPELSHMRWRVRTMLDGTGEGSSEGDRNECGDPSE